MIEEPFGPHTQTEYHGECPTCHMPIDVCGLSAAASHAAVKTHLIEEKSEQYVLKLEGAAISPQRSQLLPPGTKFPSFIAHMEICRNCGTMWAARVDTGTGHTEWIARPGKPPSKQ